MPRSRRRPQLRPLEPDRLRLAAPRTRVVIVAASLAVLLGAGGVAVAASGSFSQAVGVLRGDVPASSGNGAASPRSNPTPLPVPPTEPTVVPEHYRVVDSTTLRRAPGPQGETRRSGPPRFPALARLRALADAWELPRERTGPGPQAAFRVATFNVLGASHTGSGGRHSRFTDAGTRMKWTVGILNGLGISVAGFQEFQPSQHAAFHRAAPGWSVWPTAAHGRKTMVNALVWRADQWELVRTETVQIPYFGGRPRAMPYVLLRHRQSGQRVWFASFHNPADAHGPAQYWRDEAARRQIELARRLAAGGTPVIFTGDMNDREEYFCPLTTSTTMHAANGGSRGTPCVPPPQMNVDWIFGSADVEFAGFVSTEAGVVGRTSDHPLVYVDARLTRRRG